jgi:hypothetical protein
MEINIFNNHFKEKMPKQEIITSLQQSKIDELGFDYLDNIKC